VAERHRALGGELRHLGELVAALAAGDRRQEADGHAGFLASALAQRAQHRRRVHDRVGVRHREDRAEAAGRRGARARVDVLLVLAARRAQVHVRVDEGGERVQALRVDDLRAVPGIQVGADLRDLALAHEQVGLLVEPRARVEQPRPAQEQVAKRRAGAVEWEAHAGCGSVSAPVGEGARPPALRGPPASSSYSTAIRTTTPDSTWSTISACGESITSEESSTPRLTGPGCISSWLGARRRESIW